MHYYTMFPTELQDHIHRPAFAGSLDLSGPSAQTRPQPPVGIEHGVYCAGAGPVSSALSRTVKAAYAAQRCARAPDRIRRESVEIVAEPRVARAF